MIYPVISLSAASWRHEELLLEAAAARRGVAVGDSDRRSQASWRRSIGSIGGRIAEGPGLVASLRGMLGLIPAT
jgi:hypothetical protein